MDNCETLKRAVAEGIREALHDPDIMDEFWEHAFGRLQRDSTDYAKSFLWSGFKQLVGKAVTFFILGMLIYSIGGWQAVHRIWLLMWGNNG